MMLTFCSAILPCHRFAHHLPLWHRLPCLWHRSHLSFTSRSISSFTEPSYLHSISLRRSPSHSMQAALLTFCWFISFCYTDLCPAVTTTPRLNYVHRKRLSDTPFGLPSAYLSSRNLCVPFLVYWFSSFMAEVFLSFCLSFFLSFSFFLSLDL